jgi:hypothetical protein
MGPARSATSIRSVASRRGPITWRVVPGLQRAPGQDWLPPNGLSPRLDRMSWWVNASSRIPLIDRYADVYMWNHGGWETLPAPSSPT